MALVEGKTVLVLVPSALHAVSSSKALCLDFETHGLPVSFLVFRLEFTCIALTLVFQLVRHTFMRFVELHSTILMGSSSLVNYLLIGLYCFILPKAIGLGRGNELGPSSILAAAFVSIVFNLLSFSSRLPSSYTWLAKVQVPHFRFLGLNSVPCPCTPSGQLILSMNLASRHHAAPSL